MSTPEFSRLIDLREIGNAPVEITATAEECTALARRFDLVRIDALRAAVILVPEGAKVNVTGQMEASFVQSCAISGEDLPVTVDEPLNLRFVRPAGTHRPDEEVELNADDCDEIEFTGTRMDIGEAVAQSLALAIDPYLEGPNADKVRASGKLASEEAGGPFAALANLRKSD